MPKWTVCTMWAYCLNLCMVATIIAYVSVAPSAPRVCGSQTERDVSPDSPSEYFHRAITIPFLDKLKWPDEDTVLQLPTTFNESHVSVSIQGVCWWSTRKSTRCGNATGWARLAGGGCCQSVEGVTFQTPSFPTWTPLRVSRVHQTSEICVCFLFSSVRLLAFLHYAWRVRTRIIVVCKNNAIGPIVRSCVWALKPTTILFFQSTQECCALASSVFFCDNLLQRRVHLQPQTLDDITEIHHGSGPAVQTCFAPHPLQHGRKQGQSPQSLHKRVSSTQYPSQPPREVHVTCIR